MKNQTNVIGIGLGLLAFILLTAGCSERNRTPDEQTTMNEKAGTLRTDQQQQLLEERQADSTQSPVFRATLDGSDNAPERDTRASGRFTLTLHGDSIHVQGQFSNLSSAYTGSAIHRVLEAEKVQQLSPTLKEDKTAGTWQNSYKLAKEHISALKGDSLYISVYSEGDDEASEISGQIQAVDSMATTVRTQPQQ